MSAGELVNDEAADSDKAADEGADGAGAIGAGGGPDPAPAETVPATPATPRRRRHEWLIVAGVAILAAVLVRVLVVEQYRVVGASMLGTLHDGDRVLVDKLSYRFHDPRRGDIVVLELGDIAGDEDLIKRVIAVSGETVEVNDCRVLVDGRQLDEPYVDGDLLERDGCGPNQAPLVVPSSSVFVLGDHRGASRDSRSFGPVDDDRIVGRARVIIWPVGDWTWL